MSYEVYIVLTFTTPCLGNERFEDPEPNRFPRSAEGRVTFHQTWWRTALVQAAGVFKKHQTQIKKVRISPEIDGKVKLHKRYYVAKLSCGGRTRRYKLHEAFLKGDAIGVRVLCPDSIPRDDLAEIFRITGEYYGISPFGWDRGYGRFLVTEVLDEEGGVHRSWQPDVDTASDGDPARAGEGNDVQPEGAGPAGS